MTTLTPQTNRPGASPEPSTSISVTFGSSDARSLRTGADYSRSAAAPRPGFGAGSVPPARVLPSVGVTGPGQADWKADLLRFLGIGVLGTVAYLALFVFLRSGLSAQTANISALATTSVATIWAHERLNAGNASRPSARHRERVEGSLALGVALVLTTGSLIAAGILTTPSLVTEVAILILANLPASLLRFVLLTHHRLEQSAS